jgi:hypothetical protein
MIAFALVPAASTSIFAAITSERRGNLLRGKPQSLDLLIRITA